ncbi:unnamed protein product, partial [Iphiclides podalirius]
MWRNTPCARAALVHDVYILRKWGDNGRRAINSFRRPPPGGAVHLHLYVLLAVSLRSRSRRFYFDVRRVVDCGVVASARREMALLKGGRPRRGVTLTVRLSVPR